MIDLFLLSAFFFQSQSFIKCRSTVKEVGIFANDPDEGEILYAIAIAETDQWDYMPAYNDLLPSTITVDFLTEVANADEVVITTPNETYLYDQTTGDKYVLGVDNGLLYFEEVEGA